MVVPCLTAPVAQARSQDVGPTGTVSGTVTADWHFVGRRFSDVKAGNVLPQYNYFNFGAGYTLTRSRIGITADVLNAFQSKGLEEGNPRLALLPGGRTSNLFLARPLLPRRVQISLRHDY